MAQLNRSSGRTEAACVTDVLPADATDVLVIGPTLSDKDLIAFELLADPWGTDANPFVITATDSEVEFRSRFAPFVPAERRIEDVYVIDSTDGARARGGTPNSTCSVGTPADLTGIGVCLSKGYDQFGGGGGRRILLDNLATLLIYSDLDRVYRFLSTITGRVAELGDTTVQLLDDDALDAEEKHTLFGLFSTVVEVRTDADATMFRVRGETQTDWYEYQAPEGRR